MELALFAIGPRLALALEWTVGTPYPARRLPHWWLPLLGLIFLPWTALMCTIVRSAGGVQRARN